jgi:outer membrane protein OmpU
MKKILIATTALIATAGMAAADVTFSGYSRFGVQYTDDDSAGTSSTDVTSRLRLQIDVAADSDNGMSFGARTRLQTAEGDGDTGLNGVRFFAKTGGLEIGVGNIFGALEFMPGMYPIDLGLTGLGYNYTAYNFRADAYSSGGAGASGSNGVELRYSVGDLSVHVSSSDVNDRLAAHAAYTFSGVTVALGVQDSDSANDTEAAFSVGGTVGPAAVTFAYAKNGDDTGVGTTTGDHMVLAAKFDVGAATNIEAYIAEADYFAETSFGIDFNQDMGGGTSLRGGFASLGNADTRADLGVRFNF